MRIHRLIFLLGLSFFSVFSESCVSQRIAVIGIAYNDKNIATLVSERGQYFLKGVHHWDEKYLYKRVRVTGILLVIKYEKDTLHPSGFRQERAIDENFILKPKWKLIE